MLNVLQLIPTLDRSGAEKQVVLLAKGLPRDRFHVEVAALTRLGPLEAELREAGVPVTLIGKPLKFDPFAMLRLIQFLRRKRFDVLQTWVFAANSYGRVAARLAKVPVVVTAEMAVDLWKGEGHLWIDRFLASRCDKVVGNSEAVVAFYRAAGLPEEKLATIHSGIDDVPPAGVDPAAVRAEFGWRPDAPMILFAGRLVEQKGVDVLIDALDLLQHVWPELRTLIVGDGPMRDTLVETAQAYDLDARLRFTGHREDVPRLLAASDLLVLPSRYEGLPNVVLEAMRFGKPVVATAAPGTTELVVDGQTGMLVPLDDPRALAQAIRTVLGDPGLRRAMGDAGLARVQAHFRVDAMVTKFAELYESLAAGKGRGASRPGADRPGQPA
ncbi:MAG: glycosyltransferase [Isosphaeraceae bacterium]